MHPVSSWIRTFRTASLVACLLSPVQAQFGVSDLEKALDADGDGTITAAEIADAARALRFLDEDGDGSLSRSEFRRRRMWDDWDDDDWGGNFGAKPRDGLLDPADIDPKDGTATLPDRATFETLRYKRGMVMDHHKGQQFVKFQIDLSDPERPRLYFINTETHTIHDSFMPVIGGRARNGMRGVLVYRPMLMAPIGEAGLYTFEFDLPKVHAFERIAMAFRMLEEHSELLRDRIAYHPMDEASQQFEEDRAKYEAAGLPVVLARDLYSDIGFLPLHPGESFGRLKILDAHERPNPRDIVICEQLPNEMPRVAGVISAVMQTPLSHVNLRAIQDDVPNAYVRHATEHAAIRDLIGKPVRYRVTKDGFEVREASVDEVNRHFARGADTGPHVLERDLTETSIRRLSEIGFEASPRFGVKASNLSALHGIGLPDGLVPDGFAVPFSFYDAFMKHNALYEKARRMLRAPGFATDPAARRDALARLRKEIESATMPTDLAAALARVQSEFPAKTSLRCRSSTNNEDLPGFSGAGLYDSFTHRPKEGHLSKSIQQVFASLWNLRAFEERDFFQVDHFSTSMGVVIHPNYSDERANGVAVSEDILYQTHEALGRMYYLNVQVGEDLVTNPSGDATPEEILLSPRFPRNDRVIRRSSLRNDGSILGRDHVDELRMALKTIHREFRALYGVEDDARFAMEIEFKVTADGALAIKQARPWVF